MEISPFVLVIISSFTHAFWNFLTKRAIEKDIFVGLSKITEVAVFFIPFLVLVTRSPFEIVKYWYFIVIAAVFVFLNYVLLSQTYKHIELSLAYPISRSSTWVMKENLKKKRLLRADADWVNMWKARL